MIDQERNVLGARAQRGVVVGDRVRVEGDVSGDEGSLARVVEVNERAPEGEDPFEWMLGQAERALGATSAELTVVVGKSLGTVATTMVDRCPRRVSSWSNSRPTSWRARWRAAAGESPPAVPDRRASRLRATGRKASHAVSAALEGLNPSIQAEISWSSNLR